MEQLTEWCCYAISGVNSDTVNCSMRHRQKACMPDAETLDGQHRKASGACKCTSYDLILGVFVAPQGT